MVWISAASAWEIAIKQQLGRARLDDSFASLVHDSDFTPLDITFAHAEKSGQLAPHHSDPFDRLLIAQALVERATLVTHDRQFERYDVPLLWT